MSVSGDRSKPTVLVVEDEPSLRKVLAVMLPERGYAVITAEDGDVALALHRANPAEVILSDIMMPQLDGIALLRALRQQGDTTPIVLMSAAPRPPVPDGVGWVPKPFDITGVTADIDEAASRDRGVLPD